MQNRIDVHGHVIPPFLAEAAKAAGFGASVSRGFPDWTPELALAFMEQHGIATTLNSISQPGVNYGDAAKAKVLARRCNEFMADLAVRFPKKFGSFAVLPLPDIDGALEEITHAFDVLHHDGVGLLASYGTAFLGDEQFEPVMQLLNERRATVFIHPNYHPSSKSLGMKLPGFLVEFPIDTTRAMTNLIFSGALARFPNIKFILAHNGGALPYLAWRISLAPLIDEKFKHLTQDGILAAIRSFYFESAQAAGPAPMAALAQITDPSHLLFGSDWPYCPPAVTQAGDRILKAPDARVSPEAIFRANALKLFPRFADPT